MTHYPVEDEAEIRKNLAQFKADSEWLIQQAGLERSKITLHSANSYATLTVPEAHLDMVRPGGLLYGDSIPTFTEYKKKQWHSNLKLPISTIILKVQR